MRRLAIILAGVFVIGTAAMADNQQGKCVLGLKGLTQEQIEKINQLEDQHQQVMEGLRAERRSTVNFMEKDRIRAKMLDQKEKHYSELKKVLSSEQWAEFESLHQAGNRQGNFALNGRNNRGHGNGHGSWNRGQGRGQGTRNNGCKLNKHCNNSGCLRTGSNTSNIDTSKYKTGNFNILEF
jgi:hypothetical protein